MKMSHRVPQAAFIASVLFAALECAASPAIADDPPAAAPFVPDPASVERFGPAYRYPQAGWIVLHIEGEPYERGVQHGWLLAPEIAAITKAAATKLTPKDPENGWNNIRLLVDALFLRRYDEEFLLEMKGIADGAAAAGAKFDGRPLDLVDIVGVNAWTEVEFLDNAMDATPKGIEGIRFNDLLPHRPVNEPAPPARQKPEPPSRCSSFIATGPATADGKIVFGHITMWSLYPARHFNVWLDLKPVRGHRVLMQSFPGGIQSSMDYYFNDAGLLVSETTLAQTRFNIDGKTESSRIRKALQYADSIDGAVEILRTANNGLYTNEWLIGDTKTNEIAMFELGTAKSRLYRSSKSEWFGDTAGFYWGCNNTKDLDVRLETVPSLIGRPANVVFRPSDRDLMWQRLYAKHRGKIDTSFAFEAFTTPPLAAAHSLDAKFTTADLSGQLKTWALFGPPLGRTWEPTADERAKYPDIQPLVSNGWTLLEAAPPPSVKDERRARPPAVDLASSKWSNGGAAASKAARRRHGPDDEDNDADPATALVANSPAWHGTILPKSDGDIWLAAAFADYERIVATEKSLARGWPKPCPCDLGDAAADRSNLAMFAYRSRYLAAARTIKETSLAGVVASNTSNEWYDIASGKGVCVLAELRAALGDAKFDELMESFGREFAGKPASTVEFRELAAKRGTPPTGEEVRFLLRFLTETTNFPLLEVLGVQLSGHDSDWHVHGKIHRGKQAYPTHLELLLDTDLEPVTQVLSLGSSPTTAFELSSISRPRRLIVDPRNQRLRAGGAVFSTHSFERELEHTLIVRGTGPEEASLREAAEQLQRRIATQWSNYSVPIVADRNLTDDALRSNHILLVGRPAMNSVAARLLDSLPVQFTSGSFTVADKTYAHPSSTVVAAATNPSNPRYSLVLFAGLSAESTRRVAETAPPLAEVVVWSSHSGQQLLVLPARDLVVEFRDE